MKRFFKCEVVHIDFQAEVLKGDLQYLQYLLLDAEAKQYQVDYCAMLNVCCLILNIIGLFNSEKSICS